MRKHGVVQYTMVGLRLQSRTGTLGFCRRNQIVRCLAVSACLAACLASSAFDARAQTQSPAVAQALPATSTLPSSRVELADQDPDYWTLKKFPSQQYMHEIYWNFPVGTPPLLRDSMLQYVARTYYLTRNNFDDSKSQAWAGGGWIAFRSGLIADTFGVHAAYYTSQPLFAPDDEPGTKLLNPDQNALGMLGQIYGRVQFRDQELRGGRQLIDTPLINPQDTRMVPNTFEATTIVSLPDKDRKYDYAVGYVWSVKQRESNDFISMSDALAGGNDVDRGATFGMVKYRPVPGLSTVLMDYYIPDFLNTGFAQAEYDFRRPKEVPNWILGINVIDQRSVDADLLTGNAFRTYQASAKVLMKYAGWSVFVAGSITGDGSQIFSPFGTKPNYTDMQQVSFDNAGEKALGASVEYDLGQIGLAGVTTGAWYTHGWGALDPATGLDIPNRDELDLWLQYRPTEGRFKGWRVKTQYSNVWQDGNPRDTQPEFRFIVDYTVLFRPPL